MKTSINLTREKLSVELSIIFAAKSVISLNYNFELSDGVFRFLGNSKYIANGFHLALPLALFHSTNRF